MVGCVRAILIRAGREGLSKEVIFEQYLNEMKE